MRCEVRIDYEALRKDIGFEPAEIPALFDKVFGIKLSRSAAYAWHARRSLTLERLAQLLTLVRIETDRRLDLWKYLTVVDTSSKKRAA
jgi:hypothetical protein